MRRLNETEEYCKESLKMLENKSNFNPKRVTNKLWKIHEQNYNVDNSLNKTHKSDNIHWSSKFKNLLKFTKDELNICSQNFLLNRGDQELNTFSKMAKTKMKKIIFSKKCNKCALCGHYNKYDNMVEESAIKKNKKKSIQF